MNDREGSSFENQLLRKIKDSLLKLEERGEIVLCSSNTNIAAEFLYSAIKDLTPSEKLSASELMGLKALVFHAINDKRFFDWEMPTLTGFDADEFARIAEKLPKG